jgi:hypothetical protein
LQHLKPDSKIVTDALDNLPETLDETYERIFLAIPEISQVFVHNALKLVYSHHELCSGNISMNILLQATQRTSPELGLWGIAQGDGEDLLRKLCGCLITVTQERKLDRFKRNWTPPHITNTTPTVTFAHYTVWEFLSSNRIRNSPAKFFAVDAGLANMDFAKACMLHAVNLDTYKLSGLKSLKSWTLQGYAILDENFGAYCILCAIYSLGRWCAEICEHDDLTTLAFNLVDPSKPHFEDLNQVSKIFCDCYGIFRSWRTVKQFWWITWLTDPDSPEVRTLANLFCADQTSKLGQRFLEIHGTKNVMQTQLHLGITADFFEMEICIPSVFEGSMINFCENVDNYKYLSAYETTDEESLP